MAEQVALENRWMRLLRQQQSAIQVAEKALQQARESEQLAQQLREASVRRFTLNEYTFRAGELGLQELVLGRKAADEAEQNWQQRQIETARAVSNLNQVLGYLPQAEHLTE